MTKYLDLFWTNFKNNLVREFMYRENIFAMTFADLIWIAVEIGFFEVIYGNTVVINGWNKEQSFFFLGLFIASDALFSAFFQRNFWYFPNLITQGDLDIVLAKPVNPVFLALTQSVNLSQLLNFFAGLGILIAYAGPAQFAGGWLWAMIPVWLMIGVLTQGLVRFLFVVSAFWTGRASGISHLYYNFYQLANKPEGFYPSAIRILLKTILPFAFIGSVPARALLGSFSWQDFIFVFGTLSAFFILNRTLWQKGLRIYTSASR